MKQTKSYDIGSGYSAIFTKVEGSETLTVKNAQAGFELTLPAASLKLLREIVKKTGAS